MADKTEAKKSLGQHWLNDGTILRSIVDCADIQEGASVVEIGPGHGPLTEKLAEKGTEITALEFYQHYRINPKTLEVSSVNIDYRDVYEKITFPEKCLVDWENGVWSTFEETREKYGEDYVCWVTGKEPLVPVEELITPERYFIYKQAIENIKNGIEVDLTKLDL